MKKEDIIDKFCEIYKDKPIEVLGKYKMILQPKNYLDLIHFLYSDRKLKSIAVTRVAYSRTIENKVSS
ncbi:hypothetical protein CL617_02620 [archaeon]|jgi:hypothetical protein|nr:hypothetical protein [archaeon]|tara:strand:+ start:190 stop:393 length:204 start_codon:yes stop_codon:yes gene_type:complete